MSSLSAIDDVKCSIVCSEAECTCVGGATDVMMAPSDAIASV